MPPKSEVDFCSRQEQEFGHGEVTENGSKRQSRVTAIGDDIDIGSMRQQNSSGLNLLFLNSPNQRKFPIFVAFIGICAYRQQPFQFGKFALFYGLCYLQIRLLLR